MTITELLRLRPRTSVARDDERRGIPEEPAAADFRLLVDALSSITWVADAYGATTYINARGLEFVNCVGAGPQVWEWLALVHPCDADRLSEQWRTALGSGLGFASECRLRRADYEYRWHRVRATAVRDDLGALRFWVCSAEDVDDARNLEACLRAAERETSDRLALLETLQSKAPVGFGFVDRAFRRVIVNETLAAFNGSSVADQLGQPLGALVPGLWPKLEPLYRQVLDSGEAVLDVEVEGPSDANPLETRHWLNSYYPVAIGGQIVGIGIVAVEITERKRAEQANRELAAVVEFSGEATFGIGADGSVTSWNLAAEELFGYSRNEMVGRQDKVLTSLHPSFDGDDVTRPGARRHAQRLETTCRRRDGTRVEVLVSSAPVNDADGRVVGRSVTVQDISERSAAQRELQNSQRQMIEAQRIARIGSFEVDVVSGVVIRSAEHCAILGIEPGRDSSPVDPLFSMVHPDDLPAVASAWGDCLSRGVRFDLNYRIIRPDGQVRSVHGRSIAERGPGGALTRLVGTVQDTTDRLEAVRLQKAVDMQLEIGFEQAGIGAGIVGLNGAPLRVNAAVCALLGRPQELLVGRSWSSYNHPDDPPLEAAMASRLAAGHDSYTDERRYIRPDGSVVWAALHMTVVRDEAGAPQYYLVQLQDICERKELEAQLIHQALHDSLTDLPNRALLRDRLNQGLAGTRRRGSTLGVILIDLDHFKAVNDSFGHGVGDGLLRRAAEQIAAVIRPGDTVARLGGDEFVVVCDDVVLAEVEAIAKRILLRMRLPNLIAGRQAAAPVSMGVVVADAEATAESLLRDADTAMHVAKVRGRDRIELFDEALRSKSARRAATELGLRHAMEREEFTVFYQPVIDLSSGAIVSAEALLRWNHPDRGLISPAEFIPLAEETGLIVAIGSWVLQQACERLVQWNRTDPAVSIAVNLSVRQLLAPDITGAVSEILARSGARPEGLCLELTESVFMEDTNYFVRTLTGLKSLGVMLSIDDFGTGYSSLSYLKEFPVDSVKIDRAFVDGLGTHLQNSALVAAIIAMADSLNLGVTAEGIENADQMRILRQLKCQRAQGFYFAKAMPAAAMDDLVASRHRWSLE
jgi:diguanylate cyclase (GGDEF)-like protein/PAS domain S-box-containing protein